jgi:hypothetical protein
MAVVPLPKDDAGTRLLSRSLKDLSRDYRHTADAAARHLDTQAVRRPDRGT